MTSRLLSLDAFRGLVIAFMVLVNVPGTGEHVYPLLRHAAWDGWTPTDAVFPSFVWIIGVVLSFKRPELPRVLRRFALLFALGLVLYLLPQFDFAHMRILGVLQRLAICYLATALLARWLTPRGIALAAVTLLAVYTWLMMGVGGGRLDMEGNFAHAVDRAILGQHNYAHTKTWDPEGIVSTLTVIVTCLLGYLAGRMLPQWRRLIPFGAALLAAGAAWSLRMPVNKQLWSPSFTLLMAGMDCLLLAALVCLVDEQGWRGLPVTALAILGMNAIAIYLSHELIDIALQSIPFAGTTLRVWIYRTCFAPLAAPVNASLLYALCYTALNWVIAWALWRRNWHLRA
jgi:predicted acyltransferase